MASIFKRSKGKNVPYTIQYRDHLGQRRTEKGYTDKSLTEQLAAKLESDVRLRETGMVDADQERFAVAKLSPIGPHLAEFKESLEDNSPKYIQHTTSRLKRIVDGAGFTKLADIESEAVIKFMRKLRKSDDLGPRTFNHYLQAIDCFCNWCVTTKRLIANPLAGIERLNAALDVRHKRRALSEEELSRLVLSARQSGVSVQRIDGERRAQIYLLSYLTGLRQKEIASLSPRSFDLRNAPPTVTVEAIASKHRKKDVLPLHPELAAVLPVWLTGLKPNERLFAGLEKKKAWLMVKTDLERAGIPYKTEEGYADFHASGRHTHITELLRHGASLPEAQKLARHSDINMTMRYAHIGIDDQAKAVSNLPSTALQMRCISGDSEGQPVAPVDKTAKKRRRPTPCCNRSFGVDFHPLSSGVKMEAGGIEPPS